MSYQMSKRQFLKGCYVLIILLFLPVFLFGQKKYQYNDGPYIFHKKDSLHIQWVENGVGHDSMIHQSEARIFDRKGLPKVDLQNLEFNIEKNATFENVEKIVAISDVHGQYDIMIQLLKNQNIIDDNQNWNFGKGHLVIVGDNFDRGEKVLDILWFLFRLQKEAEAIGGKVHVLLGNHELMVLQGDLRYIHKKYRYTSGVFTSPYYHFFRKGSVLGDWIANHKVLVSINKKTFVHGGISPDILKLKKSIEKINNIFTEKIIRQNEEKILADEKLNLLYQSKGPLWYRGYFDTLVIDKSELENILQELNQETMIVGHTSFDAIKTMYDDKLIAIDCKIKLGKSGQVLIIENGEYFVGEIDGKKHKLKEIKKNSLFSYIHSLEGNPKIKITTNVKNLIRKSSKEEYQSTHFQLSDSSGKELLSISGKIRARGNIRKKVSRFPPVKLNFQNKILDSLGYVKVDKMKVVFPTNTNSSFQTLLYKEFFLYELYNFIDSNCMKAKLVDFTLTDNGKVKHEMVGFIIEDEEEYARRKNARIIEKGAIRSSGLDRKSFIKMEFFQYMIANTDWSVANKHNLEMVKLKDIDRVVALPYDFDYSGFVGQEYAVPHESLPIDNVHQRYFFSYKMTEKEFYEMVEYYLSIEKEIYKICDQATYMNEKTIKGNKAYLNEFFKLLRKPERLKSSMSSKFKKR